MNFMTDVDKKHNEMSNSSIWDRFRNELIYKNRYFPDDSEFLDQIDKIIPYLIKNVDEKSEWFRAREFFIDEPTVLSDEDNDMLSNEDKEKFDHAESEYLLYSLSSSWINYYSKQEIRENFSEVFKKKGKIWGYSEEDSGMPPSEKAGLNRASPKYISYLYLASDSDTALAEARALPGQKFSVAKYSLKKTLIIADFSHIFGASKLTDESIAFYANICCTFSSPSDSNERDYFVSQFITEYIKTFNYNGTKFDGIMFSSSRNMGGMNLTLFDDSACEFLGTSIHEVTKIEVKSRQLLPL